MEQISKSENEGSQKIKRLKAKEKYIKCLKISIPKY